ncbi:hypothetical protein RI367_001123 [Sorochytrium milnesiophthora]
MESIASEYATFASKHKDGVSQAQQQIVQLQNTLKEAREAVAKDPTAAKQQLTLLSAKVKSQCTQAIDHQKELFASVNKIAKTVDKKFGNADLTWNPQAFDSKERVLNRALALHFTRHGRFDLAETFVRESGIEQPSDHNEHFVEMYHVVETLKARDLTPALRWVEEKRFELNRIFSTLEFNLHRLRFIQILTAEGRASAMSVDRNPTRDALSYAQQHFAPFATQHLAEIQRLTCSVLFWKRYSSSPYAAYLSPAMWSDVEHQFTREYCSLLGLSPESPLYISTMVGTTALPLIMKMSTIMKEKKNEWTQQNELPVEVPLLPSYRYHSIFACPVSREQGTEENPPMMMPCGHTICNESLKRLSKNSNSRFKCPYCPSESTASQALLIHL